MDSPDIDVKINKLNPTLTPGVQHLGLGGHEEVEQLAKPLLRALFNNSRLVSVKATASGKRKKKTGIKMLHQLRKMEQLELGEYNSITKKELPALKHQKQIPLIVKHEQNLANEAKALGVQIKSVQRGEKDAKLLIRIGEKEEKDAAMLAEANKMYSEKLFDETDGGDLDVESVHAYFQIERIALSRIAKDEALANRIMEDEHSIFNGTFKQGIDLQCRAVNSASQLGVLKNHVLGERGIAERYGGKRRLKEISTKFKMAKNVLKSTILESKQDKKNMRDFSKLISGINKFERMIDTEKRDGRFNMFK